LVLVSKSPTYFVSLSKEDKPVAEKSRKVLTILLVEDVSETRELLRIWLEKKGYRVVEAVDGQEALDLAPLAEPDLILMDIRLPKLNGIAVMRRLRRNAQLKDIPAVALSALNPDMFREAALSEGFVDYLTKPIDLGELEALLLRLLTHNPITVALSTAYRS
jgi:two-component system phosphate regulon response regulator PhoB